jgi:hypothetical protein
LDIDEDDRLTQFFTNDMLLLGGTEQNVILMQHFDVIIAVVYYDTISRNMIFP